MEILDQRTVAVKFPMGKLFEQTIKTVNLGNDLTLVVAKLVAKLKIKVQVKVNLRTTNLCSC